MKLPVAKSLMRPLALACTAISFGFGSGSPVQAQTNTTSANEAVSAPTVHPSNGKADKKPKKSARRVEEPSATPRAKVTEKNPFPLPVGEPANDLKIPDTDLTGQLLSQIIAAKATRIDDEHVQMKEMKMDLNHPDGKEDFHVIMPTSVFNLKTRIITSDETVTVRTQDFELTGQGMEFNTVDRTGRLIGKVRMLIHNLKQIAGQVQPTPKPE